nr:hypothetical protein [uncultured Carboxylicivirga sp.]
MSKPTRGVIYTAGGMKKYTDEAIHSAKTLKKYNPNIQTTLFTTSKNIRSKYFDQIIVQEADRHPQKYKIENMLISPYDYTLFIDSDTEFKSNIEELFDFLLIYDLGITHRVKCNWYNPPKPTEFINYIDFNCYQGGFLLFKKNDKTTTFIKAWAEKMKSKPDTITGKPIGDQPLLNECFFSDKLHEKLNLKHVELPNKIYNARPWLLSQMKKDNELKNIKILHQRGLNKTIFLKIYDKIMHRLTINN